MAEHPDNDPNTYLTAVALEQAQREAARHEYSTKYPQHVKLRAHATEARQLSRFLDWLEEQQLPICGGKEYDGRFAPTHLTREKIIGLYLEIDPVALEGEKRQMLDELHKANERQG